MTILIKDARFLLTPTKILRGKSILIEDGRIAAIGQPSGKHDEVIQAADKIVMPGLVNAHTHAAMTLLRGFADDMPVMEWLETKIWPLEARLSKEDVYWGAKLACAEMLKGGITAFNDMYFYSSAVARAAQECGIRGLFSEVLFDFHDSSKTDEELAKAERSLAEIRKVGGMAAIGPHALYTCSKALLRGAFKLAEKHDTRVHLHLAESKGEMLNHYIQWLKRTIAAHCVWLSPAEMRSLAGSGAHLVHCPVSNAKLASGVGPFHGLLGTQAVCIGTDGAASNNSLDMFESMKFTALIHKLWRRNPKAASAHNVLIAATTAGAEALGLRYGIEKGAQADLILIDTKKPHLCPVHNPVSHVIYCTKSSDVDTVIVDGKIVIAGKKFYGMNEAAILEECEKRARRLISGA
jgi:5-methylthioadenosine/S-adenosylhomocysteine deaminase